MAISKLPADVGDENGETVIDERKIRIKPLPAVTNISPSPPTAPVDPPVSDIGLTNRRFVIISETIVQVFWVSLLYIFLFIYFHWASSCRMELFNLLTSWCGRIFLSRSNLLWQRSSRQIIS